MRVTFLGATQTVTGSKFLIEAAGKRVLIDCGMFQGLKALRQRNWEEPPLDPRTLDAVILTHAHIDHTGCLPRYVKKGFSGPVFGTPATLDLAEILLPDSASLQEEEAEYRNRHGLSKHKPALPLYTIEDARQALRLMKPLDYFRPEVLIKGLEVELLPAGHILGSSFVQIRTGKGDARKTILFTGDIGRYNRPIIHDPSPVKSVDYLVVESTYGDRLHTDHDGTSGKEQLREIVVKTARRGGATLIPSFAIGRAQEVLYILRELEDEGRIPVLPVYVDSPMATDAFKVFSSHHVEHDLQMEKLEKAGRDPLRTGNLYFTRSVQDSKAINEHRFPSIVISANGMATGGRILHHLVRRLPDERNSIVFVGFQAAGTRGRALLDGVRTLKIFGQDYAVRAEIQRIDSFSAHGDYKEILHWMKGFERPPRQTFLVHGEPSAMEMMALHIRKTFKGSWKVEMPEYLAAYEL